MPLERRPCDPAAGGAAPAWTSPCRWGACCPSSAQGPHAQITIDMLLDHTSGLPGGRAGGGGFAQNRPPLAPRPTGAGSARTSAAAAAAAGGPNAACWRRRAPKPWCRASASWFLGWVLEGVTGKPLDVWLHQEIYGALDASTMSCCFCRRTPSAASASRFGVRRQRHLPVSRPTAARRGARRDGLGSGRRGGARRPVRHGVGGLAPGAAPVGVLACGARLFFHTGTLNRFLDQVAALRKPPARWFGIRRRCCSRRRASACRAPPIGHTSADGADVVDRPQLAVCGRVFAERRLRHGGRTRPWRRTSCAARVFELLTGAAAGRPATARCRRGLAQPDGAQQDQVTAQRHPAQPAASVDDVRAFGGAGGPTGARRKSCKVDRVALPGLGVHRGAQLANMKAPQPALSDGVVDALLRDSAYGGDARRRC